jgi:CHAT domain-containing protein
MDDPARAAAIKVKIADAVQARTMYSRTQPEVLAGLQASLSMYREVATDPSVNLATRLEAQISRAHALRLLHTLTGDPDVVDKMIEDFENAVTIAESLGVELTVARACSDLATALSMRYGIRSSGDDIVRAIGLYFRALDAIPENSTERPAIEHNLSTSLRNLHRVSGSASHLDLAINVLKAAVAHTKHNEPQLAGRKADLGFGLFLRLSMQIHVGATRDRVVMRAMKHAIGLMEKGVPRMGSDPRIAGYAINLAGAFTARYEYADKLSDLSRAIELLHRAKSLAAHDVTASSAIIGDLGRTQYLLAQHTGDSDDINGAIELLRQAVAVTQISGSNDYSRFSATLGQAYKLRYKFGRELSDRDEAVQALRYASLSAPAPALAMQVARVWGELAEESSWQAATDAYSYGLSAMRALVTGQLLRTEREHWIEDAADLHTHAAFAMAKSGDLRSAAITLEKSRAMLLSSMLGADEAIGQLIGIERPELLERYRRSAERLRMFQDRELGPVLPGSAPASTDLFGDLLAARSEYEHVLREIGPSSTTGDVGILDDIRAAASQQPVVYILSHERGGIALIVGTSGDITSLELPVLTLGNLLGAAKRYFTAYAARTSNPSKWRSELESTLAWLWDQAMSQIVAAIAPNDAMVLIPIGLLGMLPLHAAGRSQPASDHAAGWVMDYCAATYTPNARALRLARSKLAATRPLSVLAVGEPTPVKAGPLRYANAEASIIASLFEASEILSGPDAIPSLIAPALQRTEVSHFSCHGIPVYNNTLNSHLLLANNARLTVRDMLALHLPRPRLAVLSACDTGIVDIRFPDEMVALPTACIQAGFSGAIGTLWSVPDGSTALLMTRFYELWIREGLEPAQALRQAQMWLRDTSDEHFANYLKERIRGIGSAGEPKWIPAPAGKELTQYIVDRGSSRSALRHPYYWGSFAYYGA